MKYFIGEDLGLNFFSFMFVLSFKGTNLYLRIVFKIKRDKNVVNSIHIQNLKGI